MCQYSGAVVPPPDGHLRQYLSFMVALHPGLIFFELVLIMIRGILMHVLLLYPILRRAEPGKGERG